MVTWLAANRKQQVVTNGITSDWTDVTNVVIQGSVLGPTIFLICINDLDEGLINKISKFADDIKIGGAVVTPDEILEPQNYIKKLSECSSKWNIKFNTDVHSTYVKFCT